MWKYFTNMSWTILKLDGVVVETVARCLIEGSREKDLSLRIYAVRKTRKPKFLYTKGRNDGLCHGMKLSGKGPRTWRQKLGDSSIYVCSVRNKSGWSFLKVYVGLVRVCKDVF